MIEILEAVYSKLENDNGKDSKGNWLDDYDHRTYVEMMGTPFYKHLVPAKQPELMKENMPIVAFSTSSMPTHRLSPLFKDFVLDFDIYTHDNTFEENLKIAKRHFQLLEGEVILALGSRTPLPYIGKWWHVTEMQVPMLNPNFFCYSQRFITAVKREKLVGRRKI